MDMGLIKKIAPIIDASKITSGLFAVATARVEPGKADEVLNALAKVPEIRNVYGMTGEHNVLFTVFTASLDELQTLLGIDDLVDTECVISHLQCGGTGCQG